jgi:putative ABC transport system permease protein
MIEFLRKMRGLLHRKSIASELEQEMRTHLEMKAADAGGLHAAQRTFGNTTLLLEEARSAWGWPRLEGWLRDFRYGFRRLGRRPAFALTVVITIGLGIGASTTVFSLVDTVLLRPLPYPNPERLVAVYEKNPSDDLARTPVAPGRLEDWQRLNKSFEAVAGSRTDILTDTTGPEPERISAAFVSPRFLTVLGAAPELGRSFQENEERFGGPQVAVISDGLWRRRFGADPLVLGRTLALPGGRLTVVGVMPPAFQYPSAGTEIWIPDRASPEILRLREARFYQGIGRLKPGLTAAQAGADLAALQTILGGQYPKTDAGWSAAVTPLVEALTGSVRLALWMLLGSVGVLLLLACANVACLMLAQFSARGVEMATRLALGAGRTAVARQLLAEGLVYAFGGGLLGLGAALLGVEALQNRLAGMPRINELTVDARLLGFALGVTVLAAVLFSLAPIVQTFRRDLASPAIRGGRGIGGGSQHLSRFLVAAQLAMATLLLVGSGLFLRSWTRLQETPMGFRADHVLTFRIGASFSEPPAATLPRHQRTLEALAALPGVKSAAMSAGLPGVNSTWAREFQIAGEVPAGGTLQFAGWRIVTAEYFQTLAIPIVTGRTCRMSMDPQRAFEAVVNRSFVDRYLQGRDPIGRTIQGGPIGESMPIIVGVAADAKEDGASNEVAPVIYACGYLRYWPDSDILLRTAGDPASMINATRTAIRALEPARPVYAMRSLMEAIDNALAQERFRAVLVGLFSAMALTLAAVGLYGVTAYTVSQRTREIGVRVALGARPGQIVSDILASGGRLAAAGAASGVLLSAGASRFVGVLVYGVPYLDAAAYLGAVAILIAVALLACLIPARRATSIDPVQALRQG